MFLVDDSRLSARLLLGSLGAFALFPIRTRTVTATPSRIVFRVFIV